MTLDNRLSMVPVTIIDSAEKMEAGKDPICGKRIHMNCCGT